MDTLEECNHRKSAERGHRRQQKKLTMSSVLFLEIEGHTMMSHYIDINKKERRP